MDQRSQLGSAGLGLVAGVLAAALCGGFLANLLFQKSGAADGSQALRDGFRRPSGPRCGHRRNESLTMCTGELDHVVSKRCSCSIV